MARAIKVPRAVTERMKRDIARQIRSQVLAAVSLEFEKVKKMMIEEFLSHPVSVEISNGPLAKNTSQTLGGYGNLFSFIGFDEGEKPVEDVLRILELTTISFSQRGLLSAKILMPTAKQIFEETPMPARWAEGRSWTKGIESGISGLNYYLHIYGYGASGAGIQAKGKVKNRPQDPRLKKKDQVKMIPQYRKVQYISALINKYYALFSRIRGANLRIKNL